MGAQAAVTLSPLPSLLQFLPPKPTSTIVCFPFPPFSSHLVRLRCRLSSACSGGGGNGGVNHENDAPVGFSDEDGVVNDMDRYLNHLSLEYDSVWDTKPAWCQPWTIMLTGAIAVACSWVLHSILITGAVFSLTCAWWYIFLYVYPKAYSDMIAERRKKVTKGIEDTFGMERSSRG